MSSVDVVIPCYNYARFLPQCVASVLGQEGVEVRVLIIDDCSSDDSEAVGRYLAEQDRRVEFRRHTTNLGHIATYNEGLLDWADGEYVLLLSADDVLTPKALARATQLMDETPEVGLCYGRHLDFTGNLPVIPAEEEISASNTIMRGSEFIEMSYSEGGNLVPTPTAVARTALQKMVGGYKPELPHTGDLEMWLRFAANASIARLNSIQALKRVHSENMSNQFSPTLLPDLQQRKLAFEFVFREYAGEIGGTDELLNTAIRSLANQAFWGAHASFEKGYSHLCDELLHFALELDPSWSSKAEWRRLKWKRRIGGRLWNIIEPLVKTYRRSTLPDSL